MPVITDAQRHKLNRDPITDAHVLLLEFQEDGQSVIERAAINTEDIVWNGETYYRAGIEVKLPSTGDGDISAQLVAANVDRLISRALDKAEQRINVRMIMIDTSAPDATLIDTENLLVMPIASTSPDGRITASPSARANMQEPVPDKRTTKQEFPGAWLA